MNPTTNPDITVREWLRHATPGSIITGNNSGNQFRVTKDRELERLTAQGFRHSVQSNLDRTKANRLKFYTVHEAKDNRPKEGQRVQVKVFGTVTSWKPTNRSMHPDGSFEIKTDNGRFIVLTPGDNAIVEIQHEPLPGPGVVIRHIETGTKRINIGGKWHSLKDHASSQPVDSNNWALLEQWQNGEWDIFSDLTKD